MLALGMLIGRFGYILPVLALAGALASKNASAPSADSFATHGLLFITLLTVTLLIVGGLTFLPVLALGPIAEHLNMHF
jgi:K+-transporting ATPase ATPase A chain